VLQAAVQNPVGNADLSVVQAIDEGLRHCNTLLAVLSERTMGSWWVPYEIGAARAQAGGIAHLLLPPLSPQMIPEYLRIYEQLWTAEDVSRWARALSGEQWKAREVQRLRQEWAEGGGWSTELGPDEEEVLLWYQRAEAIHARQVQSLASALAR
jgi:hypothetical protein